MAKNTKQLVIACADSTSVMSATAKAKRRVTYGCTAQAEYQLSDFHLTDSGSAFSVLHQGKPFAKLESPLIGKHNALNAIAAMIAAQEAGIDLQTFSKALASLGSLYVVANMI